MKKTIFVLVYNRPEKTRQCLEVLRKAKDVQDYQLLIVRQEGNKEVKKIIDDIDWIKCFHHTTRKESTWSVERAINHNIHTGLQLAFEIYSSDFVIVLEDDLLVGFDFLNFCEVIITTYKDDKKFFAVNGCSKEPCQKDRRFNFGKFRYYVTPGWSIPKHVWAQLKEIWTGCEEKNWDLFLESTIRTGYVVMPHCSRIKNIGWGGVHWPKEEGDPYYTAISESWVGCDPFEIRDYVYDPHMNSSWREDYIRYSRLSWVKQFLQVRVIKGIKYHPTVRNMIRKVPFRFIRKRFHMD